MATIKMFKKSALPKTAMKASPKGAAVPAFGLLDNEDDTFTVTGVDAAGAVVDISNVASIAVVSGTPAVATVDAPVGMTFTAHALTVGHTDIAITATFASGTPAPLTATLPLDVSAGGPTGLLITPGTPVIRP